MPTNPRESKTESIAQLTAALTQTQADVESEKAALVKTLHDDVGGMLVGAIMDIGWISRQPGQSDAVREKLARASSLLHAAVDMERSLIENLRPTLLDNVGLFSTLKWHVKASCEALGITPEENCPAAEAPLSQDVKIGVFRIIQEALKRILSDGIVRQLSINVSIADNTLQCLLESEHEHRRNGMRLAEAQQTYVHLRARRLGGVVHWLQSPRGHQFTLTLPFSPVSA